MVSPRTAAAIRSVREGLARLATSSPAARRAMARAAAELGRAARIGEAVGEARASSGRVSAMYGGSYFGEGRDPSGDRQGHSGYASYDRVSSNADIAAYLLWRHFRVHRALDVGCARGFLVEALRDRGIDAYGCDASPYAVEHAASGALGFVRLGDPTQRLPFDDGSFDLVTALETLEHLPPDQVPRALAELRRVCGGICYATIPSVGRNPSGPDGHFDGKVRPERLAHYRSLGEEFLGPVPPEDLAVDAEGQPIEGHLTIASYRWWTDRFAEAGFDRWADVERRLYADVAPVELERSWNIYVLAVPDTPFEVATPRTPGRTLPELGLVHPLFEHAAATAAAAGGATAADGGIATA